MVAKVFCMVAKLVLVVVCMFPVVPGCCCMVIKVFYVVTTVF